MPFCRTLIKWILSGMRPAVTWRQGYFLAPIGTSPSNQSFQETQVAGKCRRSCKPDETKTITRQEFETISLTQPEEPKTPQARGIRSRRTAGWLDGFWSSGRACFIRL